MSLKPLAHGTTRMTSSDPSKCVKHLRVGYLQRVSSTFTTK
jgi:hypothetical protein